jgi:hypothetical protein
MRTGKCLLVSAFLLLAVQDSVLAETPDETRARVLKETKFNLVQAEALPVPVSQYKGDGNPMTLELVIFSRKSDGPSRVSEDGEVIFFYAKDSQNVQQQLIQKAFQIRIVRAQAAAGT